MGGLTRCGGEVVAQAPEPERSKSAIDMRSMAGSSLRKRP